MVIKRYLVKWKYKGEYWSDGEWEFAKCEDEAIQRVVLRGFFTSQQEAKAIFQGYMSTGTVPQSLITEGL